MNNLKPYHLFLLAIILCLAIGIHFFAKKNVTAKENLMRISEKTESTAAAGNLATQSTHTPLSLQKYSAKMPQAYKKTEADTPGINYSGPDGHSTETIAYFKKLSDQGDAQGKFLYANHLRDSVYAEFTKESLLKGKAIDTQLWQSRVDEVKNLYIESAAAGISLAAEQLPVQLPNTESDKTDELSWALITDKMNGQESTALALKCEKFKAECSEGGLEKALDRARFYLDYYNFNTTGKPVNSPEK